MSETSTTPAFVLLEAIEETAGRFALRTLDERIAFCRRLLAQPASVTVAVLGGFNTGKSSFINTLGGEPVLPVGVLPTTSVLTSVAAGSRLQARVALVSGATREVAPAELADWVTQERNPDNAKGVASVRVEVPALACWPGLVFIDTPGLGSVFAQNSIASLALLPRVEAAVLAVSCAQPLSAADVALLRQLADSTPRLAVLLTKADLCTPEQQAEVVRFVGQQLRQAGVTATIHLWSQQAGWEEQRKRFLCDVLQPLDARPPAAALEIAVHKTSQLWREVCSLLAVGAAAARRNREERERLRARLDALCEGAAGVPSTLARLEHEAKTGCMERTLAAVDPATAPLRRALQNSLDASLRAWGRTLATAGHRYEAWLRSELERETADLGRAKHTAMLAPLADFAAGCEQLVGLFHTQLADIVRDTLRVSLELPGWEAEFTPPERADISIDPAFDLRLDWLWVLTPAAWVRPWFRRHLRRRVAWEVEKNLSRLAAQWSRALGVTIMTLGATARTHVETQRRTLSALLAAEDPDPEALEEANARLRTAVGTTSFT